MNKTRFIFLAIITNLFLIGMLVGGLLNAQSVNLDSLRNIVTTTPNKIYKINALNTWAFELRRTNADSSLLLAKEALRLSELSNYKTGKGDYYFILGSLVFNANPDSAIWCHRKANNLYLAGDSLHIAFNHSVLSNAYLMKPDYDSALYYALLGVSQMQVAGAPLSQLLWGFKRVGDAYYYRSNFDSALFYLHKALAIADKINDLNAQGGCLTGLGNIYGAEEDYPSAIDYTQRSVVIYKRLAYHHLYLVSLSNLAGMLCYANKFAEAGLIADSALAECKRFDITRHLAHNYQTKGEIKDRQQQHRQAIKYYLVALKYSEQNNNQLIHYQLLDEIGNSYLALHEPSNAINYITRSLEASDKSDREHIKECYLSLSRAYKQLGNTEKAYDFLSKYSALKDTIYNEDKNKTIAQLNTQYETREKEEEIKWLKKDGEAKTVLMSKEKQLRNLLLIVVLLVFVLAISVYYRFRERQRKEQERTLLNERLRLSRDLHDDIGSTLSSIPIFSEEVKRRIESNRISEALNLLNRITADAREMVNNMGDMVWLINPQNSNMEHLVDRIHSYASYTLSAKNISLFFHCNEGVNTTSPTIEAHKNIYLIMKEALNNLAKYSNASKAHVIIAVSPADLEISISDNGKGFDATVVHSGNGLKNMYERAKSVKATLNISSALNAGTKIVLVCPIQKISNV